MIWLIIGIVLGGGGLYLLHGTLTRLAASLIAIDNACTAVVSECQRISKALDSVPALQETQRLTGAVPGLVNGYVASIAPLL